MVLKKLKFSVMFKPALFIFFGLTFLFTYPQPHSNLVDVGQDTAFFELDIRYATSSNFTEEVLYDCAKCLLLPEVAQAIINANYYFCDRGYKIKFFDCYRPLSIQKIMWKKVPNPIYVADPKKGSVHNRGASIDLTIVTLEGKELDMGSDYDYFGRASHTDFYELPKTVLENRKLLQEGVKAFGFSTIQSEWWHFSFLPKSNSPVLDIPFDCKN